MFELLQRDRIDNENRVTNKNLADAHGLVHFLVLMITSLVASDCASAFTVLQSANNVRPDTYDLSGECFERTTTGTTLLADVELKLFLVDHARMSQKLIGSTTSDMAGGFVFAGLVQFDENNLVHPMYVLLARLPGYATHRVREEIWQQSENELDVAMTPAGSLKGRAIDPDGAPIVGMTIFDGTFLVNPVPDFRCTQTDEDGNFELADVSKNLPAANNRLDNLRLLGSHPDWGEFTMSISDARKPLQIRLFPACRVNGRVLDAENNQPVTDCIVVASQARRKRRGFQLPGVRIEALSWVAGRTDESGNYQLNLFPNAKYNLFVFDTLKMAPAQTVATEPSKAIQLDDFRLEPTVAVSGQVLDVETGKPIRGPIQVFWNGPSRLQTGAPIQGATTLLDGSFVLNMIPGLNFPFVRYGDGEFIWHSTNVVANGQTIGKNGLKVEPGITTVLKIFVDVRRVPKPDF